MSELEVKCRPLILPLAYGHRRIFDLSDKEALVLARWAVKTAYALHSAANWRVVVDQSHYQVLNNEEYRLPEGVYVLGHTYKCARSVYWMQSTNWRILKFGGEYNPTDHQGLLKTGYKISIRIGGLFLLVAHNPLSQARLCLVHGRHFPLYPRWSHPVSWTREDKAWPSQMDRRLIKFDTMVNLAIADWNRLPENTDIRDPKMWMHFESGPSLVFGPDGQSVDIPGLLRKIRRNKR
jgi:hypothetical protein